MVGSNRFHSRYHTDGHEAVEPDEPASDRAPLTGNIQNSESSSSREPIPRGYLTSQIAGEDRRAPQNTIDESVWATVSRDLLAIWEKMKQVLWPKYLLGGMLTRGGAGMGDVESQGFGRDLRGLVGRWPDADGILQGGMSEGLRDWDLWCVHLAHLAGKANTDPGVLWYSASFSARSSPCAAKSRLMLFSPVFSP